jgi:outer membrane protein TolC
MNRKWNNITRAVLLAFSVSLQVAGQQKNQLLFQKDSLALEDILNIIYKNNPQIKQSMAAENSADLRIKLAGTAYLPNIDGTGNYTRMGPIPAFDLPNGHIQLYPDNALNLSVGVGQLLYDFGKTTKNVEIQKVNSEIAGLNIERIRQNITLSAAVYFYNLIYVQSAIILKKDQIENLNRHLRVVEAKRQTGSATQFETLTTQVRISTAETELADLFTLQQVQLSHLCALMDIPNSSFAVRDVFKSAVYTQPVDSFINHAMTGREELIMINKKQGLVKLNYELARIQNSPTLSLFANGGFKNGYLPEVEKLKGNYNAGIGFRIPIFDANRRNINLQIAISAIDETKYESDQFHAMISDEIIQNYSQYDLAKQKIDQRRLQLDQANEAYNQAILKYKEGTITNLDMLDAANTLSEARLLLLRARTEFEISFIRLELSSGYKLY